MLWISDSFGFILFFYISSWFLNVIDLLGCGWLRPHAWFDDSRLICGFDIFYSFFISFDFMWRLSYILLCSRFYWDFSFSIYSKFLSSCHWSLNPQTNSEVGFFILAKHWVHCLFPFLLSFIPQCVFVSFPLYTWSPNMWPCSWLPPMKFLLWANTLEPEVFMNLGQSMRYVNVVLSVVNQWIDRT